MHRIDKIYSHLADKHPNKPYHQQKLQIRPTVQQTSQNTNDNSKQFDMEEVSKHNTVDTGVWIVIDGQVYDITEFINKKIHFTTAVIEPYYGADATAVFKGVVHSNFARKLLSKFKIGHIPKRKFAAVYQQPVDTDINDIYISKIFIYPIKSCRLISVKTAYISDDGLSNDRIYAFANKKTLKVVNQLRIQKLALIRVGFMDSSIENFDTGIVVNNIPVPLKQDKQSEILVKWKSAAKKIKAWDQGAEISNFITNFINNGNQYILVRVSKQNKRRASHHYSVPSISDNIVGFQNYIAMSVTSEQSLNELNRKMRQQYGKNVTPVTWLNTGFRMNIVLDGLPRPNSEDMLKKIRFIGDEKNQSKEECELVFSKRRYTCLVPTVNQDTSKIAPEPIQCLSTYRNALTLNDYTAPPGEDSVYFGSLYAVKANGVIHVGQKIK